MPDYWSAGVSVLIGSRKYSISFLTWCFLSVYIFICARYAFSFCMVELRFMLSPAANMSPLVIPFGDSSIMRVMSCICLSEAFFWASLALFLCSSMFLTCKAALIILLAVSLFFTVISDIIFGNSVGSRVSRYMRSAICF